MRSLDTLAFASLLTCMCQLGIIINVKVHIHVT
jgi:hypothetical protein